MALWTEEKSEVMDQKVKEYEEQKKRDEEMRAEIKRQQEERRMIEEEKQRQEEEQRMQEQKRREEEERIQREIELAKAAGERAENASVQTEEQAMQARSVQQLKKGDGSEIGLNIQSKTSDFKIFNDKTMEPLWAEHKDDKHAPASSQSAIKIQVQESVSLKHEPSNSHKDQKSEQQVRSSREQEEGELLNVAENEKLQTNPEK